MVTIRIENQEEWDKLPKGFKFPVVIEIGGKGYIKVDRIIKNATVVACNSAKVRVCGFTKLEARGSATVWAQDWAKVEARHHATVEVDDSATVSAYDGARVIARYRAKVRATDYTRVEAYFSATVEAYGQSTVEAYDRATVVARMNAVVRVCSENCSVSLYDSSVGYAQMQTTNLTVHSRNAAHIHRAGVTYTKELFLLMYRELIQPDGRILLYKLVRLDRTDFLTGKIAYHGVVECHDWDPDPHREYGGGLHLSPSPEQTEGYQDYTYGELLTCLVHPDDFVVHPSCINKVRCRRVEVVEHPVLLHGKSSRRKTK